MSDRTCGNCMLPIQPNEPGIRHYGFYAAHAEYRCYALLRERAERAETELARVTAERDQYRLERDQRGAEATEFHLERDEARAELASLRAEIAERKEMAISLVAQFDAERCKMLGECNGLRAELEALSRRIAEAPIATVKHYDYCGEWALVKEASMTIFEPLKGHRVALVRIDGEKA